MKKLLFLASLIVSLAHADDISVKWERNPQSLSIGYKIYHANWADTAWKLVGSVTNSFATEFIYHDANPGFHYFTITSFDRFGNESAGTEPILVAVPFINVQPPINVYGSLIRRNRIGALPAVPKT